MSDIATKPTGFEDQPAPPDVPNLSVDEYREVCRDKKIPYECELCGHPHWDAGIPDNHTHAIMVKQTGTATYFLVNKNLFMPVNRFFCTTCGNVRTHTSHVVEAWRRLTKGSENGGR